jgi:hypothetical protein
MRRSLQLRLDFTGTLRSCEVGDSFVLPEPWCDQMKRSSCYQMAKRAGMRVRTAATNQGLVVERVA